MGDGGVWRAGRAPLPAWARALVQNAEDLAAVLLDELLAGGWEMGVCGALGARRYRPGRGRSCRMRKIWLPYFSTNEMPMPGSATSSRAVAGRASTMARKRGVGENAESGHAAALGLGQAPIPHGLGRRSVLDNRLMLRRLRSGLRRRRGLRLFPPLGGAGFAGRRGGLLLGAFARARFAPHRLLNRHSPPCRPTHGPPE